MSDEAKDGEEKKKREKKQQREHANHYVDFFFPIFLYSKKIDDNSLCNETSKYDFNTIAINKAIVDKIDIYYFSHKINISSVRSIDDSMHAHTLEQIQ